MQRFPQQVCVATDIPTPCKLLTFDRESMNPADLGEANVKFRLPRIR